ncbi:hypothetical protein [Chryseobacterium sp. POE27]|uniref:hypothetical protein n=1 Tax=Chryseobacterium sp. POE27 TaxID=3138177 RepID=UPI00321A578C
MKIVVASFIIISVSVSAQQKKLVLPKKDTAKVHTFDPLNQDQKAKDHQKKMYEIPSVKPDESMYSSLKDKRKDTTDYKMLNSLKPEKPEPELPPKKE